MIPNPHGELKPRGRTVIFEGDKEKSLILKEGILDGTLEVYVLC
jgi:hypothetical protein